MVEGCMDFNISSQCVFYLECDKGREDRSYQVYIEFCYFYVLVLHFFYKFYVPSTICFNFWSRKYVMDTKNYKNKG